jgi:hypothetical protein
MGGVHGAPSNPVREPPFHRFWRLQKTQGAGAAGTRMASRSPGTSLSAPGLPVASWWCRAWTASTTRPMVAKSGRARAVCLYAMPTRRRRQRPSPSWPSMRNGGTLTKHTRWFEKQTRNRPPVRVNSPQSPGFRCLAYAMQSQSFRERRIRSASC